MDTEIVIDTITQIHMIVDQPITLVQPHVEGDTIILALEEFVEHSRTIVIVQQIPHAQMGSVLIT